MKNSLGLAALLFISASPAFAGATDNSIIRTDFTIAKSCSIGNDLNINLTREGLGKYSGSGALAVSQTGSTKWSITSTQKVEGQSQTGAKVVLTGPSGSNLKLTSTSSQGQNDVLIQGSFSGDSNVAAQVYTTDGKAFQQGRYQTQTTVNCVTQ